ERCKRSVIAFVERQVGAGVADLVTEQGIIPANVAADGLDVGVEDELSGGEAVAPGGLVRPVDARAVELPRLDVGQVDMPDLVGLFSQGDPLSFRGRLGRIEQTQLDLGSVLREKGEIDAGAVPGGTERIGSSRPDAHALVLWLDVILHGPEAPSLP